jgi:ketose-bisphosphate aldolases
VLYTGKSILDVANAHSFAIPAFNISDWAMFTGIMDISEEKNAPVIIAIHPDEVSHITTDLIPAMHARAHRSSVPVAIHWDHGGTYEQIITAIQAGFTSVMIDASLEPFEQNVALTRKVVEAAHAVGVQVEGELGTIGANDSYGESGAAEIIYTNVDDAVRFVEQTGVDSLAIAIGTSHGLYPSDKNPELRHDLLEQIKAAVGIPLVLHGGSSNPDAELSRAVSLGHQQDQHLERHQGGVPRPHARGARHRPAPARAQRDPARVHRGDEGDRGREDRPVRRRRQGRPVLTGG